MSYASIYRAIHAGLFDPDKCAASRNKKRAFAYNLRRKGKKPRLSIHDSKQGTPYTKANRTSERPLAANERSGLGHFEADTVLGKRGGDCLLSLVDRKSRFTMATKLYDRTSDAARDGMISLLGSLPPDKVKSVTPDRGSEFTLYAAVSAAIGNVPFYFADPHAPWQRGTNENTNGLIREFLPKNSDMTTVLDSEVTTFITLLNLRPRKCLGW